MPAAARLLIVFGLVVVALGVLLAFADKLPPWLGRLPGDIYIKRDNFTFYFPLATSLLISTALTLVLYLLRR